MVAIRYMIDWVIAVGIVSEYMHGHSLEGYTAPVLQFILEKRAC